LPCVGSSRLIDHNIQCTCDKSASNIEGYKIAKRVAKRAVCVAKGQAYDGLYQRLVTKEGEKDIYRMASIRERKTRDITQIKCIKDGTD
jgi:hypothetical protein